MGCFGSLPRKKARGLLLTSQYDVGGASYDPILHYTHVQGSGAIYRVHVFLFQDCAGCFGAGLTGSGSVIGEGKMAGYPANASAGETKLWN